MFEELIEQRVNAIKLMSEADKLQRENDWSTKQRGLASMSRVGPAASAIRDHHLPMMVGCGGCTCPLAWSVAWPCCAVSVARYVESGSIPTLLVLLVTRNTFVCIIWS